MGLGSVELRWFGPVEIGGNLDKYYHREHRGATRCTEVVNYRPCNQEVMIILQTHDTALW